jgi:hypothetical protein
VPSKAEKRVFKRVRHVYVVLEEDLAQFVQVERRKVGMTARAWVTAMLREKMLRERLGV